MASFITIFIEAFSFKSLNRSTV